MIRWKLKEFLHDHNLTVYKLTKAAEGRLSSNHIYILARGTTKTVELETLNVLIETLQDLTNKPVNVADLLEYQAEGESLERKPS